MNLHELIKKHNYAGSNYSAHIYGSAPSVSVVKKMTIRGIKIAVGDMPWRAKELGPYDFWMTNNTYFPIPWKPKDLKHIKSATSLISTACVNGPDGINILNDAVNRLKDLIEQGDIILYDAQHFKNSKNSCRGQRCCEVYQKIKVGLSIQEELSNKVRISGPAYQTGHATINAIALAMLFNCNPIFIHGVELPEYEHEYNYYNGKFKISPQGLKESLKVIKKKIFTSIKMHPTDFFGEARKQLLSDFESIGKIAYAEKVDLFCTSKTSPLNKLKGYTNFDADLF